MTDLIAWLGTNATLLTALSAMAAAVFSAASISIQIKQNRQRGRISSGLTAAIGRESNSSGTFLRLELQHQERHRHKILVHSIRRAGWFWQLRGPYFAHGDRASRLGPSTKPSVWERKLRFSQPVGNIGISNHVAEIFISDDAPSTLTIVAEFARIEETTRIRRHKIRVYNPFYQQS